MEDSPLSIWPELRQASVQRCRHAKMAAGAPVQVMVGSDCHAPFYLWDEAVELSYRNLEKLGIIFIDSIIT